jgi:hypothetical protein
VPGAVAGAMLSTYFHSNLVVFGAGVFFPGADLCGPAAPERLPFRGCDAHHYQADLA